MNIFKLLFNKNQIKMENKLNLFLALHAHYSYAERKDTQRLAKLAAGIDNLCDELIKDVKLPDNRPASIKDAKKDAPAVELAKSAPAPIKPVQNNQSPAKTQAEIDALKKAKADAAKAEADQKAKDAALAEVLIDVMPFYPCEVLPKGSKYAKSVNVHAPRSFKAWDDENAAKAAKLDTLYPSVTVLELVLDEAWDWACKGRSGKDILEMCKKELKGFYPELKADTDWYSKLVNPIVGMVGFIKKAFGYKVDDKSVTVTRPTEKGCKGNDALKFDSDCFVEKPKETVPAAKVEEKKPELKTVQTGKAEVKPAAKVMDEEAQEAAIDAEKAEVTDAEVDEPTIEFDDEKEEERDTAVAPAVHSFDEFDEFETMVFDKLLEGAKLAKDAKSEEAKRAIQAENKEEVRNLIASNFEGEEWTVKTEDGKWNPLLISYYVAIVNEIQKNKEKWAKK